MSPPPHAAGFSTHTIVTDTDCPVASRRDVQDLADKVVELQAVIGEHDGHAQRMVSQALQMMLEQLPEALETATERAVRRVATDKELHKQIGESVLEQATMNMHRKVGRFIFNRWFAMAALVVVVANAIGWPETIKALLGIAKAGP